MLVDDLVAYATREDVDPVAQAAIAHVDQAAEGVGVVPDAGAVVGVARAPGARLVPCNDGELVGQTLHLVAPLAPV